MGERLDTMTRTAQDVDEFQQAVAHVSGAATKRMPEAHTVAPTPALRRMTSGPSAFTPMVKLKPTKTLDLPQTLQDALRYAGVSYNYDTIESIQDSLRQARLERHKKLQDHYDSTSTSEHATLAERSSKADGDFKVISTTLYKHSPFQQVSLTSAGLQKQLNSMEEQLEEKERELLEAEGTELSLSDPKVRAFMAKYGRSR